MESERSTRLLFHTGVVLVFHIHCAVSGTNLAHHHRTCATRGRGGGRCFRLLRVALGQSDRSRDGEDSKTNKDDFLHAQLPGKKRRTAVNHKPWTRVKNRSQSEPESAMHCSKTCPYECTAAPPLIAGGNDCLTGKSPGAPCIDLPALSSPLRKNILFFRSANHRYIHPVLSHHEGRWPTSLTRGRMRWTQGALKTRALSCGR